MAEEGGKVAVFRWFVDARRSEEWEWTTRGIWRRRSLEETLGEIEAMSRRRSESYRGRKEE